MSTMKEILARLERTNRRVDMFSDVRDRLMMPIAERPPMNARMRRRMRQFMDRQDRWDGSGPPVAVLSSATGAATGATTANIQVTTTEGAGMLYAIVTTKATTPTADQIKKGQDYTGVAAAFVANQAVTASGVQVVAATGLTASSGYYGHFVHWISLDSNTITTNQFTTTA